MASNLIITQNPSPTLIPGQPGQISYTDISYNIIPDISNNPTYTLRTTDPSTNEYDVFINSTSQPQAFIPNSLFISTNLTGPCGMCRDSVGNFYVVNGTTSPGTISVYASTGTFTRTITLDGWTQPRFCEVDTLNNVLYVSSESNFGIAGVYLDGSPPPSTNSSILTIFGVEGTSPYSNVCRQMKYLNGYLYIAMKQIPGYIVKYNISTKAYVSLNVSSVLVGNQQPIALVLNPAYVVGGDNFLYFTTIGNFTANAVCSVSQITGTETLTGGVGSATVTLITTFTGYWLWGITIDSTGSVLYVMAGFANSTPVNTPTYLSRILISNPSVHNLTNVSLSPAGPSLTRCRGVLFDGTLDLYVTDEGNNRALKTRPNTFLFGGPASIINGEAYYFADKRKTYLYDISDDNLVTTFLLNPAECFKKGTQILCENDIYIPIEELKIGTLVKTYKHGYKKVITILHDKIFNMCSHDKSCSNSFQNICNQMYTYSRESNPYLIADLHLTGGHSLLLDTLTDEESNDMSQINWAKEDFMIEDKYKLLTCYNSKFNISTEQDDVDVYHFILETPKNAKSTHVYGIYANGILAESCSILSMEKSSAKKSM
jgi:hypothetical protein